MLTETRALPDLLARLREERRVWVRLAVTRPLEEWQLSVLEVTLAEPPPGWLRRSWWYERAAFIAAAPVGTTVAAWIERGRVQVKPVSVPITVHDSVQLDRRQSRHVGIFQTLPWPSTEWKLHVQEPQNRQMLHGELVAEDAPAFLSYDLAAAAFFGVEPSAGGRNFSGCEFIVREQDRRARIDSVRVRPTEAIVNVTGAELTGTMLTLGGLHGQTKRIRRSTTELRFPLASGIPSGSWLALHRGHDLLDRRGLDPTWGGLAGVEIEIDPATEVEVLISGGEGASTEFKRQLPSAERDSIVTVMKTVAAFANGGGGTLLFGVENDGTICGLGVDEVRDPLDRLTSLISDWIRPTPDFDTTVADVDGKKVLLVRVEPGSETPYGVGTTDKRVDYYMRRGGTSSPARPADVRAVVRARLDLASKPHYLG